MEDPNLIFTLKAATVRAETVLAQQHNSNRYVPPPDDCEVEENCSREATPATNAAIGEGADYCSQLRFTFDLLPKDIQRGFEFGSNPASCDVLLERAGGPVSRQHFCITFDDQERVVLKDTSSSKTTVSYSGQAAEQPRNHFTWILFPEYDIRVEISENLEFRIELAEHESCVKEFSRRARSYLEASRNAIGPLDLFNIHSLQSTAASTEPVSPRRRPIYIMGKELGRGDFGRVYKAADASTGYTYAAKSFQENCWKREVEIMRGLSLEHLVQFVDFTDEVTPYLVMEYLPLGNLQEQHERVVRITDLVVVTMLKQLLRALEYLHSRGVVHRDIKPQNILVRSRGYLQEPSQFWVKLGDFGLAKDSLLLATFCGTQLYLAPEVKRSSRYTSGVDIWALGVVIFQYAYGLPRQDIPFVRENWYRKLIRRVEDWDSEDLMDLLSSGMLEIDPQKRLSARAYNLGTPTKEATPVLREAGAQNDFLHVFPAASPVSIRLTDFYINATQILTEARGTAEWVRIRESGIPLDIVCGPDSEGTYVKFESGIQLCQGYGLSELERLLRQAADEHGYIRKAPSEGYGKEDTTTRKAPPRKARKEGYFQVIIGDSPISIREVDFRVNATQILKAAGKGRQTLTPIRKSGILFDVVQAGEGPYQGRYVEFAFGIQLCRQYDLCALERLLQTTYENYNRSVRAAVPAQNDSKIAGCSPPSPQFRRSLHESAEGTELEEGQCSGSEGGSRSESPNSKRLRSWPSTTARKYDGASSSCASIPLSSQLDGLCNDPVRAEDSEPEESEPIGDAQEAEAQEDATESEGGNHSEEHESPNSQHSRNWASRRNTTKTIDGASSSCASIDRFDQRSVFTEPSFSRGSFLPVNGSFLTPVHPGLLHEHQSSPSPLHYESVPDLWGA